MAVRLSRPFPAPGGVSPHSWSGITAVGLAGQTQGQTSPSPQGALRAVLGPPGDSRSRGSIPAQLERDQSPEPPWGKIFHAGGRAVIRARSQNFPDLGGGVCTAEPCRAYMAHIRSHTPAPKHPGRLAFHFYTFSLCFWAVLQPVFGHDKAAPTHICVTAARGHEVFSLVLDPPDTRRSGIWHFPRRGVALLQTHCMPGRATSARAFPYFLRPVQKIGIHFKWSWTRLVPAVLNAITEPSLI